MSWQGNKAKGTGTCREWLMREWDAGEEVGGEGQATQEQMREVGTGEWMGEAVRSCGKEGKSEDTWWADRKWHWRRLGNVAREEEQRDRLWHKNNFLLWDNKDLNSQYNAIQQPHNDTTIVQLLWRLCQRCADLVPSSSQRERSILKSCSCYMKSCRSEPKYSANGYWLFGTPKAYWKLFSHLCRLNCH